MPRSYSFDHYQVPTKDTNLIHEQEKRSYVESRASTGEPKIHYGKAHAQTEELATVRKMNAQLEELAALDEQPDADDSDELEAGPVMPRVTDGEGEAELPEEEPVGPRVPIGALPAAEEPPTGLLALRELLDTARGHTRLVRLATRDIARASFRLATLPLQIAALATRHLRTRFA